MTYTKGLRTTYKKKIIIIQKKSKIYLTSIEKPETFEGSVHKPTRMITIRPRPFQKAVNNQKKKTSRS